MPIEKDEELIWESYIEESMKLVEDITDKYDYYNSYQSANHLVDDLKKYLDNMGYEFDKDTRRRLWKEFFRDIIEISSDGFQGFLNTDRRGVKTFQESLIVDTKDGKQLSVQVIFKIPPSWMDDHEHRDGVYILKIT